MTLTELSVRLLQEISPSLLCAPIIERPGDITMQEQAMRRCKMQEQKLTQGLPLHKMISVDGDVVRRSHLYQPMALLFSQCGPGPLHKSGHSARMDGSIIISWYVPPNPIVDYHPRNEAGHQEALSANVATWCCHGSHCPTNDRI